MSMYHILSNRRPPDISTPAFSTPPPAILTVPHFPLPHFQRPHPACRRWSGAKSPIDGNAIFVLEKTTDAKKFYVVA